jgi:hypothetical protein
LHRDDATNTAVIALRFDMHRLGARSAEHFAPQPARRLRRLTEDRPNTAVANQDEGDRRSLVCRGYLNPVMFRQYRQPFHDAGFEIVDCPPMTAIGNTRTDTPLVLDTVDALLDSTHFDRFVVFSAHAEFSSVLRRLRDRYFNRYAARSAVG